MATLQIQHNVQNATTRRLVQPLISDSIFMPMPIERKIHKSGIDEANEDIKAGRIYRAKSVEDLFEQLDK